jgi:hypothetical protein
MSAPFEKKTYKKAPFSKEETPFNSNVFYTPELGKKNIKKIRMVDLVRRVTTVQIPAYL